MAKYVPDVKTQRWVVIAPTRAIRPKKSETTHQTPICPFCPGNESMTPPEFSRIGGGEPDATGWDVRVIPNKYPITDIHEVIVHSPNHADDIETLPVEQVTKIFTAYRDRAKVNEAFGQVIIFCNHGESAGASLTHPHSQLVVVPKQINLDAVSLEPATSVVEETDGYQVFCPDFSQWPYEVWIAPKEAGKRFSEVEDEEISKIATIVKRTLQRIGKVISDEPAEARLDPTDMNAQARQGPKQDEPFVYNYYIHHGSDWFIRIIPRIIYRAGFELGTGLSVNVLDPSIAAQRLKEVQL